MNSLRKRLISLVTLLTLLSPLSGACLTVNQELVLNRLSFSGYKNANISHCLEQPFLQVRVSAAAIDEALSCLPMDAPLRVGVVKDIFKKSLLSRDFKSATKALSLLKEEVAGIEFGGKEEFIKSLSEYENITNKLALLPVNTGKELMVNEAFEAITKVVSNAFVDTGAYFGTTNLPAGGGKTLNTSTFSGTVVSREYEIIEGNVFSRYERTIVGQFFLYGFDTILFPPKDGDVERVPLHYWRDNLFFVRNLEISGVKYGTQLVCLDSGADASFLDNKDVIGDMIRNAALTSDDFVFIETESAGYASVSRAYKKTLNVSFLSGEFYLPAKGEINTLCDIIFGKDWIANNVNSIDIRRGEITLLQQL